MKKRDMWLLGGLLVIGVGVYISRKQSHTQQTELVRRGNKWVFPDRFRLPIFPTYGADPATGQA